MVDWQWFVIGMVRPPFCAAQDGLDSSPTSFGHLGVVYSIHAVPKDQVSGKRT